MTRLEIRAAARRDLEDIRDYSLSEFGLEVATAYLTGIRAAFARILDHPEIGQQSRAVNPPVRWIAHRRHRIFYRVADGRIEIVRILHRVRDARQALRGAES